MDFGAKNKWCCLLFLLLIACCSGFVGVIQGIAIEDHPDRTFGYGVEIPGNVKIPGRAITSFLPAYRLPPINVTRVLTTCHDWQTSVSVKVYEGDSIAGEGEREEACARYYEDAETCDDFDNIEDPYKKGFCEYLDLSCHYLITYYKHFGNLELHGIPPAPRGSPQFEVTFDLKEDKRLHVSVTDKGTMKSNSTSFTYGIARHRKLWAQQMDATFQGSVDYEVDPTLFPATRNYVDPDAVCL